MTPNSSTDSATRDGLEVVAYGLPNMIMFASVYEHTHGYSPGCNVPLVRKSDADTILAASRAEVEKLRAEVPQWISPQDEMPPPLTTVPTLSKEKRATTGWAHSYGSWNDDPDDNSRPDSKMFKARTAYWCRLPMLPEKPSNRSTTPKG